MRSDSPRPRVRTSYAGCSTPSGWTYRRGLAWLALALSAIACTGKRIELAPSAIGCYAVELDSFPAVFNRVSVERPPELIRMDTVNGVSLQVPRAWAEWKGLAMRSATVRLLRPEITIRHGRFVRERRPSGLLPADSLVLHFTGIGASLDALLEQDPAGDWFGTAYVISSATPDGLPFVPIALKRRDCGTTELIPYMRADLK